MAQLPSELNVPKDLLKCVSFTAYDVFIKSWNAFSVNFIL